jgi:hypothetical protein
MVTKTNGEFFISVFNQATVTESIVDIDLYPIIPKGLELGMFSF